MGWVERYQALIAGALALIGAVATVWAIVRQIKQVVASEADRRQRTNYAARAMLPNPLAEVQHYAELSIAYLTARFPPNYARVSGPISGSMPAYPAGPVSQIRECIEFGEDPSRKLLADLISHLQLQNSRLRLMTLTPENLFADAAEVYALCDFLYPYARREVGVVERSKLRADDVKDALKLCHVRPEDYPSVHSHVEVRATARARARPSLYEQSS